MDKHPARILLVDDEPSVLLTLSSILRLEGYQVDEASGGLAAMAAVQQQHYDLVLTDLKMPEADGIAVLAEVQRISPQTVTVIMTGYASLESALQAIQLGAYEYLLKPTEVSDLLLAVRRSLERKRFSEIDCLYRVGRELSQAADLGSIVALVSEAARRVLALSHASLCPLDRQGAPLECDPHAYPLLDSEVLRRLSAGEVLTAQSGFSPPAMSADGSICAFALVPGLANNRLSCVLWTHNGAAPFEFHASGLRFLQALADAGALALENTLLLAELRRNNQELLAANLRLGQLDQLKSRFLSIATHELRTPLSVMLGHLSVLAEDLKARLAPDQQDSLSETAAACKRLIRLVNSMLDINQIESGKMPMNFAPADLGRLVHNVVAMFRHQAKQKRIRLKVQTPARPLQVEIDAERLQQVLINLIDNALKFTPRNGGITITLHPRAPQRAVEVSVSDTGVGIPSEDQALIFEEFVRVARPRGDPQLPGSGLGLSLIHI